MRDANRRVPKLRPELERLEGLTLLSGVAPGVAPAAHALASTVSFIPLPVIVGLKGTTRGTIIQQPGNPDTGATLVRIDLAP